MSNQRRERPSANVMIYVGLVRKWQALGQAQPRKMFMLGEVWDAWDKLTAGEQRRLMQGGLRPGQQVKP
jgi:hypothetical protein